MRPSRRGLSREIPAVPPISLRTLLAIRRAQDFRQRVMYQRCHAERWQAVTELELAIIIVGEEIHVVTRCGSQMRDRSDFDIIARPKTIHRISGLTWFAQLQRIQSGGEKEEAFRVVGLS